MRRRALSLCVRAFPREWRARYGEELAGLLTETERAGRGVVAEGVDLLRAGLTERARGGRVRGRRRVAIALPVAVALAVAPAAAVAPVTSPRPASPGTVIAVVLHLDSASGRADRVGVTRVPVATVIGTRAAGGWPRSRR